MKKHKILFICHGNICRSPMAEFLFKHLAAQAGLDGQFEVASAATSTEEIGNSVYPPARRKLAEHNISCAGKTARQLTCTDGDYYDLLIGMDEANRHNILRLIAPENAPKVYLLMEFAGQHKEVADPWYTGDFEATWQDVLAGCQGLLTELAKK